MHKPNIFIAGHNGMVGSSLYRILNKKNYRIIVRERKELDLLDQYQVKNFFKKNKIDQVYLAAAKVGGIVANNTYPADFIYENIMIQANVIHGAFLGGVKKLLFLGSSCIYPKNINRSIKEKDLLTGRLEQTNEPYSIAKIAGLKMCESYNRQFGKKYEIDYRCIMPTNLYGPGDNYHPQNSHVIPGLISRFHQAKIGKLPRVIVWGSGKPKREFLYVDDMARASIFLMKIKKKIFEKNISPMCSHINVGSGKELSIKKLSESIKDIVGYKGEIIYDKSKPDGNLKKLINSQLINKLGFVVKTNLKEGLKKTYENYLKTNGNI
jgi:GDP-L-fucose synthase